MVHVRTKLSAHGVKLWNTLPDDIKNCTSVNIFLKNVSKNISYHTIRPHYIVTNQLFIETFSKSIIL